MGQSYNDEHKNQGSMQEQSSGNVERASAADVQFFPFEGGVAEILVPEQPAAGALGDG